MDLYTAETLATELMVEHGLIDSGWTLHFDGAESRLGVARHDKRHISLSRPHTLAGDEAQVRNTILHEIAHARVGAQHGHGPVWKAMARAVGASPRSRSHSAYIDQRDSRDIEHARANVHTAVVDVPISQMRPGLQVTLDERLSAHGGDVATIVRTMRTRVLILLPDGEEVAIVAAKHVSAARAAATMAGVA